MIITINNIKQKIDLSKVLKYKVHTGDKIVIEDSHTHSPIKFFTKKVGNALHLIDESTLEEIVSFENYFIMDDVNILGFKNANLSSYSLNSTNEILSLPTSKVGEVCLPLNAPLELDTTPLWIGAGGVVGLAGVGLAAGGGGGSSTPAPAIPETNLEISLLPEITKAESGLTTISGATNLALGSPIQITITDVIGKTITLHTNVLNGGIYSVNADLTPLSDGIIIATASAKSYSGQIIEATDTATLDTLTPTATITMSDSALIKGETSVVSVTFSEEVANFDINDITVENGTLSSFSTNDNITWMGIFTPTDNIEDTTNIITLANTYTDVAGNIGTAVVSDNYTLNTTDITPASAVVFNLSSSTQDTFENDFHITAIFSEAITGLTASDFVFTHTDGNATYISSNLSKINETTYSFDATYKIDLNATDLAFHLGTNSYSDLLGNGGTYVNSNSLSTSTWW